MLAEFQICVGQARSGRIDRAYLQCQSRCKKTNPRKGRQTGQFYVFG